MSTKYMRLLLCASIGAAFFNIYIIGTKTISAMTGTPQIEIRMLVGTIAVLWICWRLADHFLKENGL